MTKLRLLRMASSALALSCALVAGVAVAQSADGTGDTVYRLHGSVVNGSTGKPLARALVTSADNRLAAMSDSEGDFSIDVRVPAPPNGSANSTAPRFGFAGFGSRVYLTVRKPGFIAPQQLVPVALDETLSSTSVQLTLMPAATIVGRVSAAGADSVANVRVMLLSHQVGQDGRRTWTQANSVELNARGDFHFANLRPGEYSLMTQEWRGDPPLPLRPATAAQIYPPTFYGDRPSLTTAEKLHLHFGDSERVELHLHATTYYPVSVPVAKPEGGAGVNIRVLDASPFSGYFLRYDARTGAVEGSLPNGQYNLLLMTSAGQRQGNEQTQQSYGLASIQVEGASVSTAPVVLAQSAPVMVEVHSELTANAETSQGRMGGIAQDSSGPLQQPGPSVQLILESEGSTGNYASVRSPSGNPDELTLNAPPGKYFVRVQGFQGYVASMSSGTTDLFEQPLVVGAGTATDPIEITVRDDNPRVTGTVNLGGEVISQPIHILLLPTDNHSQFVQSFAGMEGQFTVNNLAPGSYRVLAFRNNPPPLAYREPETLSRFDGKGSTITAAAGQTLQIQVDLLDDSLAEEN